jgi:hypothetical protein
VKSITPSWNAKIEAYFPGREFCDFCVTWNRFSFAGGWIPEDGVRPVVAFYFTTVRFQMAYKFAAFQAG